MELEERLRKRLEELKALQAQVLAQLNAINGAIGEIEAILEPPKDKPPENIGHKVDAQLEGTPGY